MTANDGSTIGFPNDVGNIMVFRLVIKKAKSGAKPFQDMDAPFIGGKAKATSSDLGKQIIEEH